MFAQEREINCHQLLLDNHNWCNTVTQRLHDTPCLFYDIMGLNLPNTVGMKDSYTAKRRKIKLSPLVRQQVCAVHSWGEHELDCCATPVCHFGCSGLPCTDMSTAGLQRKRHGPTNAVFMTHGKFVCSTGVPLIVVECTPASCLCLIGLLASCLNLI